MPPKLKKPDNGPNRNDPKQDTGSGISTTTTVVVGTVAAATVAGAVYLASKKSN